MALFLLFNVSFTQQYSWAQDQIEFFLSVTRDINAFLVYIEGGILFYVCLSFRPSKIFFVTFFSATIDGRDLIFSHELHIGTLYRGKRFWTHQIPTSCLPTLLIFIHIEHTFCIYAHF